MGEENESFYENLILENMRNNQEILPTLATEAQAKIIT